MSLALDRWDQRAIAASLSANGFVRRSPWRHGGRAGHREWLHFTVHAGELTLVVNASFIDDLRPAAPPHGERIRLLVLARDAAGWHGGVDDVSDATVCGGQFGAALGDLVIAGAGAEISLRGRLRDADIELELVLTACAFPSLATGVSIGDGPPIHWLVVPRLVACGRAVIAGRAHIIDGAPAYHDHNWGFFSPGDLAWQWGHDGGTGPHSVVLARLLDGAHATAFMQALLVWRGARQVRVFRGDELRVEPEGFLRPERPLTVPRTAALLVAHVATEVPRRLHIAAAADGDAIEGAFEATSVARIVVPHDGSLAATVIHEAFGQLRLRGTLHDAPFAVDAPAMFEFLRGVA